MFSITERSKEATNCLPPILLASTRFSGSIRSPFLSSFSKLLRQRIHFPKDESFRVREKLVSTINHDYPCTQFPVTRFTDNARSLSRITAPPTPFFTEPTIDDSKNVGPTTLAEVSIVFSSRGARKTLTRRAHSLVLNFFHFSLPDKQSLHARTQRGEESAVATRFE